MQDFENSMIFGQGLNLKLELFEKNLLFLTELLKDNLEKKVLTAVQVSWLLEPLKLTVISLFSFLRHFSMKLARSGQKFRGKFEGVSCSPPCSLLGTSL